MAFFDLDRKAKVREGLEMATRTIQEITEDMGRTKREEKFLRSDCVDAVRDINELKRSIVGYKKGIVQQAAKYERLQKELVKAQAVLKKAKKAKK